MALLFSTQPTTGGTPYGIDSFYVDVMFIAPHGTADLQVRLQPRTYIAEPEPRAGNPLPAVDGIHNISFSGSEIISSDFWTDINAGNVHDKVIEILESETPAWAGLIQKITPLPTLDT